MGDLIILLYLTMILVVVIFVAVDVTSSANAFMQSDLQMSNITSILSYKSQCVRLTIVKHFISGRTGHKLPTERVRAQWGMLPKMWTRWAVVQTSSLYYEEQPIRSFIHFMVWVKLMSGKNKIRSKFAGFSHLKKQKDEGKRKRPLHTQKNYNIPWLPSTKKYRIYVLTDLLQTHFTSLVQ